MQQSYTPLHLYSPICVLRRLRTAALRGLRGSGCLRLLPGRWLAGSSPHPGNVVAPTHTTQTPPRRSRPCMPGRCCLRQTLARPARPCAPPSAGLIEHGPAPCGGCVRLLARGTRLPPVAAANASSRAPPARFGRCAPTRHPRGGGGCTFGRCPPGMIDVGSQNFGQRGDSHRVPIASAAISRLSASPKKKKGGRGS